MNKPDDGAAVCLVGLGNMGSALAETLLAKGRRVTVWNRTASRYDPLVALGATAMDSLPQAIASAPVTILCVSDHQTTESLLQADDLASVLNGKLLVQLSTCTAAESKALARRADSLGADYLDGSIMGYPETVREQSCTILYSGPRQHFEAHRALLQDVGGAAQLVSETVGAAPTFDKAIYSYHYGSLLAFMHGAALCAAAGIPIETYSDRISGHGPETKIRFGRLMAKRCYSPPSCALKIDAAAYDHVVRLSKALGVDAELPETIARYFARGLEQGRGEEDTAVLFEVLRSPEV